jgi:hypothetical protein
MTMKRLIYQSQPFGFDDAMLDGILLQARRNNPRNGLTGALVVRADLYLQLLEGPDTAVMATFDKIRQDNRHLAVRLLVKADVTARLFANWSMHDDPAQSWLWSADDVARGALDRASPAALAGVFERIAAALP